MNIADGRCLRQRVEIAVVLEIFLRVREPFAANFLLAQAVGANGRAHRAVDDDDALAEGFLQEFGVIRHKGKDTQTLF